MDMTELADHLSHSSSLGESIDRGTKIVCDRCGKTCEVTQVKKVTWVSVRQA